MNMDHSRITSDEIEKLMSEIVITGVLGEKSLLYDNMIDAILKNSIIELNNLIKDSQEELGSDFEKVLVDNLYDLYEDQ